MVLDKGVAVPLGDGGARDSMRTFARLCTAFRIGGMTNFG